MLQTSYGPARTAIVPNLVEPEELIPANALFGLATNLYVAVGPLVGGILFAAIGARRGAPRQRRHLPRLGAAHPRGAADPADRGRPSAEPLVASAATGARFVWADVVLRAMAASIFLLVAFIAVDNVALVFLVRETLGGSALAYGVIEAVFGVGMLVGSLWILRGRGGNWLATRLYVLSCGLSLRGSFGGAIAPNVGGAGAVRGGRRGGQRDRDRGDGNGRPAAGAARDDRPRLRLHLERDLARPRHRDGPRRPRRRRHLPPLRVPVASVGGVLVGRPPPPPPCSAPPAAGAELRG